MSLLYFKVNLFTQSIFRFVSPLTHLTGNAKKRAKRIFVSRFELFQILYFNKLIEGVLLVLEF